MVEAASTLDRHIVATQNRTLMTWPTDSAGLMAARQAYDDGLVEICTGSDSINFYLYAIPRKRKVNREVKQKLGALLTITDGTRENNMPKNKHDPVWIRAREILSDWDSGSGVWELASKYEATEKVVVLVLKKAGISREDRISRGKEIRSKNRKMSTGASKINQTEEQK